jgi:hypothetical protein
MPPKFIPQRKRAQGTKEACRALRVGPERTRLLEVATVYPLNHFCEDWSSPSEPEKQAKPAPNVFQGGKLIPGGVECGKIIPEGVIFPRRRKAPAFLDLGFSVRLILDAVVFQTIPIVW